MHILNYIEEHRWTWLPLVAGIKLMEFFVSQLFDLEIKKIDDIIMDND